MRLEEALELLQSFVYTQTQQHLNTLQIAVLRGSWEHQSYEQGCQNLPRNRYKIWHGVMDSIGMLIRSNN